MAGMGSLRVPAVVGLLLSLMLAGGLYAWAQFAFAFAHPGLIGPNYNAPGTDWMVFYDAARDWLTGRHDEIFDGFAFTARLNADFGYWLSGPLPFHPWLYPPSFLLLVLPFGLLPFGAADAAFLLLTLAALAVALAAGTWPKRQRALQFLAVVLAPGAAVTVIQGQNAFLIAAVLVAGVTLLDRRPLLAGAVLGVLSVKPQFCLMVPVAVLAAWNVRAMLAGIASALALFALSAAVLGWHAWEMWLANLLHPSAEAYANWVDWSLLWGHSVLTCALLLGVPQPWAGMVQAGAIAIAAAAVAAAFARPMAADLRLAILLAATLLAAPQVSPYDTVMLAVGVTLLLRSTGGLLPAPGLLVILLAWLMPLLNPPRGNVTGFLSPLTLLGFIALAFFVARRSEHDRLTGPA